MSGIQWSAEFFPPSDQTGVDKLLTCAHALTVEKPNFFSVTYGAGGSTRAHTQAVVATLLAEQAQHIAPHLTCIATSRRQIIADLSAYRDQGVRRLVALRGDIPDNEAVGEVPNAQALVALIREHFDAAFTIDVAGYPETHPDATSAQNDLRYLKAKVDAGADRIVTQFFFNSDAFFRFVDDCRRLAIDVPIVPGILPVLNYQRITQFAANCGAEIPRWLTTRAVAYQDDPVALRAFFIDVVIDLCQKLQAQGIDTFHFFTLNQSALTLKILQALR